MPLMILGLLLVLVAIARYSDAQANKRLAAFVSQTGVLSIGELRTLHQRVAREVGRGAFARRVAIWGTIVCARPLQSEIASIDCVAYRHRVARRWEEHDSESESGISTGSDTLSSADWRTPFAVRDENGEVIVLPDGAELDLETVVDISEPPDQGGTLRHGTFQLDLSRSGGGGSGRSTTGYDLHEEALPVGATVYVLGVATDASGELRIVAPSDQREPFWVSRKRPEQLLTLLERGMASNRFVASCAAIGLVLMLFGLYTN